MSYGFLTEIVPMTNFHLKPDSSKLIAYSNEHHSKCILPANSRVGKQGIGAATADASVMAQLKKISPTRTKSMRNPLFWYSNEFDHLKANEESKKKRTKKLYKRVFQVLCMIAGSD